MDSKNFSLNVNKLCLMVAAFGLLATCVWYVAIYRTSNDTLGLKLLPASKYPSFLDALPLSSLKQSVAKQLIYFETKNESDYQPPHPDFTWSRQIHGLSLLSAAFDKGITKEALADLIRDRFHVYEVSGAHSSDRRSMLTGYYLPVVHGSLKYDPLHFPYPLYRRPNMYAVNITDHRPNLPNFSLRVQFVGDKLVPMFTREEIDFKSKLKDQGLELVFLSHYMDQFFLHIQGSGYVKLDDGSLMAVGYHDKNGRPYTSIGAALIRDGHVSKEQMSMHAIRRYFELHPEDIQKYAVENQSYVFFRVLDQLNFPLGDLEVPLTADRSIASDHSLMPPGSLVYIEDLVEIDGAHQTETMKRLPSRFVVDQDTGGAIKGYGRFDLFLGSGDQAERSAGHMKHNGRAYYLLAKDINTPY